MDSIPMDATLSISEPTMETPMQPPSLPEDPEPASSIPDPAPASTIPDPAPASTIPDPIQQSMLPSVQSTMSQSQTLIEATPSIPAPQQQQNLQNSQSQHHSPQVPTPRVITTPTSTHPPSPFSNFNQNFSNSSPSSTNISSTPLPPLSTLPMSTSMQRSGIAIGVPAASSNPRSGPVPFSSFGPTPSFGQPFIGGIPHPSRSVTGVSGSNTQTRSSLQEIQGMRPSLVSSTLNQQRPSGQQPVRSISQGISMPSSIQKLSNQGMPRVPSVISSTGSAQNTQSLPQPWLVRSQHPSSFRPQIRPQVLQQRHAQQQQHYQIQQKQFQQQQKQQQISLQTQQQIIAKNQQGLAQQLLASRAASQKTQLSGTVTSGSSVPAVDVDIDDDDAGDSGNHMVRRQSIQELISQVDSSEKLDPEVEEILLDIADDFIESAMTGACSLAKHRKSTTLESKDLLVHLERNWNMTLPGFGGEEMKSSNKRLSANDVHKDRLAAIKRSMTATLDSGNSKKGGNG